MKAHVLILTVLFSGILFFVGTDKSPQIPALTGSMNFNDTQFNIVTDSFTHNFGTIPPVNQILSKEFRYVGPDTVYIIRAWTGDPHYVCGYPKEPFFKGKRGNETLSFCFSFHNKIGYFHKVMGIVL